MLRRLRQTFQEHRYHIFSPIIGAVCGIIYAVLDEQTVRLIIKRSPPKFINISHDVIDFVLPVVFGIVVGIGINVLHKQARLNKALSIEKAQFQRDLLVHNLASLFLHEIRNPIHNVAAALEDSKKFLPPHLNEVVDRNLKRFEQISNQYKKWGSSFDEINLREPVELRPWLSNFIEDKVRRWLKEINAEYREEVESVRVNIHPILLEQLFITIFDNAHKELKRVSGPRYLELTAGPSEHHSDQIDIMLINRSLSGFPPEVLEQQGRVPVESRNGLGLGLTLLKRIVEQVSGELHLSNEKDCAKIVLTLPGTLL
jgi:signal transduction histidine kinase